jgi:hypothetical protein
VGVRLKALSKALVMVAAEAVGAVDEDPRVVELPCIWVCVDMVGCCVNCIGVGLLEAVACIVWGSCIGLRLICRSIALSSVSSVAVSSLLY